MAFYDKDSDDALFDVNDEDYEPLELFATNIYRQYGGKPIKKYNSRAILPT